MTLDTRRSTLDSVALLRQRAASPWARAGEVALALLDADGRLLAAEARHARHLAAFAAVVGAVRARFGDDLAEGDLVVHNDPYSGGTALVDLSLVAVRGSGGERRFGVARLRTLDVGGGEPGGVFPPAREVLQEGDRVPPVRIAEGGRRLEDVWRRLAINTRCRSAYRQDLEALCEAAGQAAMGREEESGRRKAEGGTGREGEGGRGRQDEDALRALEGALGGAQERGETQVTLVSSLLAAPVRVTVRVARTDSGLTIDFAGTDAAASGPLNVPWAAARGEALAALAAAAGRDLSWAGLLGSAVAWSAPEGCFVRPSFPAACGAGATYAGFAVREAVARALAELGLPYVAGPRTAGGTVLCGAPEAEYSVLLPLDCPGVLEELPEQVPGVRVQMLKADGAGQLVRLEGPADAGLRLTAWWAVLERAPSEAPPGLHRAGLPATVWLPHG